MSSAFVTILRDAVVTEVTGTFPELHPTSKCVCMVKVRMIYSRSSGQPAFVVVLCFVPILKSWIL